MERSFRKPGAPADTSSLVYFVGQRAVQCRRTRLFVFLLWVIALCPISVWGSRAQTAGAEAEAERQSGLAFLREGEIGKARAAYQRALEFEPDKENLRLELADIYLAAGLPEDAEREMAEASRRSKGGKLLSHYNLLYHDLAELWAASGRIGKAREAMERASGVKGPVAAAVIYKKLGDYSTDLLQFDEALAAYRQAMDLDPGNAATQLALGNLHLRRNSLDEALSEFTRLAAAEPASAGALHGMAEVHLRRGQFAEAVAAAGRVLERVPDHRGALYVRGTALVRTGHREEGERDLREFRRLDARVRARDHRDREIQAFRSGGLDLMLSGRYPEALATLRAGIEAYPDAPALYLALGQAQSESGRHEDAIETFLEWLDRGIGENRLAHRELAQEYLRLGDTTASARHRVLYEAELKRRPRMTGPEE